MRRSSGIVPYLFVLPGVAIFAFGVVVPLVLTAGYSFTDWNGFGTMRLVGFANYIALAGDAVFRNSFAHILVYIAATLVLEVLAGLGLAGLAASRRRDSAWFRAAVFAPVMLPMVVVATLWSFVLNPDFGLVNGALKAVGLSSWTRAWLGDPATALVAICVVSGWVFSGLFCAIFYAALAQVPTEVVEAARLDGAGEWAVFWRIKVPVIVGTVEIAALLCITGGFQGFDLFYVLTNGGPFGSTEIPTTYLVRTVFTEGDVGYGSAMAVVLTAIVVGVGIAYSRVRARRERREALG